MIAILGGNGYVSSAFAAELEHRGLSCRVLSRSELDYTSFAALTRFLRREKPLFLINAAGYTGKPNVDACETKRADVLLANVVFPQVVANACETAGVPWAHVSSGCVYSGGRILEDGCFRVEKNLALPHLRCLVDERPECVAGYREEDVPNFSFREPPCSFYSGTKALAEESLAGAPGVYVWRLRMPFDEVPGPANYLSKLLRYERVYDNVNSLSHRGDFVRACIDLWERQAAPGIYNITNPGFVTTRQVIACMQRVWKLSRPFAFWEGDEEFYRHAAVALRSNCVLDSSKLLAAGVRMRPVMDAVEDALDRWTTGRPDL